MTWRKVVAMLLGCKVVRLTDCDGEVNFRLARQKCDFLLTGRLMGSGYTVLFPDGTTSKSYINSWEEV